MALYKNWNISYHLDTFSAQRYAVFAINLHGSCYFGDSFSDNICGLLTNLLHKI